jgi:hypothetical protein
MSSGEFCLTGEALITAAHCARTIPTIGGRSLRVADISRSAVAWSFHIFSPG